MNTGFYVDPQQLIKDRAEFAKRGISKGLSVASARCRDGMIICALNPSSLSKIGEVHDQLAFAGVGKFHEFESLRQAAIRYADIRAYQYSRADVTGIAVARALAQNIGAHFIGALKPLEVEALLVEGGLNPTIFKLGFDGTVNDSTAPVVIGAGAEKLENELRTDQLQQQLLTAGAKEAARIILEVLQADRITKVEGFEIALLRSGVAYRSFERVRMDQADLRNLM